MQRFPSVPLILLSSLLLIGTGPQAEAQETFHPLDQRVESGVAGRWSLLIHPQLQAHFQPLEVRLPSTGEVTFYPTGPQSATAYPAPAQAGMFVGCFYRFKISEMPEFPGVELYPSVEVLDRLHPPAGLEHEFPVPIEFTAEEIETALQDRMVTKVIYLEEPDLAMPEAQGVGIRNESLAPQTNLLKAADQRGRPMALVRLGGRVPDFQTPSESLMGNAPLVLLPPGTTP